MDIAGEEFDVIVVGAGNAATCAALSAREGGARVLMLEVAPEHWRGGNSAFTGGAWRTVYHGFDDLARLIPDISDHELANVDVGRLTEYRSDPDLTEILITRSFDAGLWMREQGVRFQLGLGRQAFRVDGKFKFWGGLACHIWGGGKELMKALHGRAERQQIAILYDTPAVALLQGDDGIAGVRVRRHGRLVDLRAKAVVLASGRVHHSIPFHRRGGDCIPCGASAPQDYSAAIRSKRRPIWPRDETRTAARCGSEPSVQVRVRRRPNRIEQPWRFKSIEDSGQNDFAILCRGRVYAP